MFVSEFKDLILQICPDADLYLEDGELKISTGLKINKTTYCVESVEVTA